MYLLVPVDFSRCSEAAMREACELASATGADLLALHVIHDPGSVPGYYTKALLKKPLLGRIEDLSLIHISEPTRRACRSRMPSSA